MEDPSQKVTDEQLLEDFVRTGREEPFDVLVQRHKLVLFNLAYRVLYDRHAAEDVVQWAFIRLLERKNELEDVEALQWWLYKTALNLALDMKKTMRRRKHRERLAASSKTPLTPRDAAASEELRGELDIALARLKDSLRVPLVLRFLQGLSYGEAGKVMDLSAEAVRKRVNRGLRALRKLLVGRGLLVPLVAIEAGLKSIPAEAASATFLTSASSILKAVSASGIAAKVAATSTSVINGGLIMTAKTKIAMGVGASLLLAGALIHLAQKSADRSQRTSPLAERQIFPPELDSAAGDERGEGEALSQVPGPEISEQPVEVKGFDIAGKVVDKAGKPIEAARVEVNLFISGDSRQLNYMTEGHGKFGFRCPDAKGYSLVVSKEDYVPVRKHFSRPEKDIVVMMLVGGAIEGNVVDAVTNEPLELFRIVESHYLRERLPEQEIYPPDQGRQFWDPEGRFRVSGLETGTYTLTSIAEGYAQSSVEAIKVELEETVAGVVIQQQPAGGVYGRVVDAIGKPIEGANIIQKKTGLAEIREMHPQVLTTSDAKGEFEIGGLPEGTFTLEARHGDYGPAERKVEVNKGEITEGVEFQLLQGGMISGMVLAEADSLPIAGVRVRLRVGPRGPYSSMPSGGTVSESDQSGLFRFLNLKPGTYHLIASASDFAPETVDDVILEDNKAVTDLIIKLSQGGSLVGTVRDPAGKPVADAHVGATSPLMQKHVTTDEDGNYAIRNLKEGNYDAGVSELTTRTLSGRMQKSVVRIENGKETRLDIVLGGPLKVYGKVTQGGKPQPGLEIVLMSSSKASAATKSYVRASGETDPNGDYEIGDLKPGEYRLMVMNPRIETQVTLADADVEKNIELPEGGISGKVLDAETGKPLEGVKVGLQPRRARDFREAQSLKWGYYRRSDTTDSEGRYDFSVVEDGPYFVVASKEGYSPQAVAADVQDSQGPSDLDLLLSRGTTLHGRVTGSDPSRPVQEIFLSARDFNGVIVYSKNMNLTPEGEYETAALSPGEYTVSVEAKGYASATKKVSIVAGADNRADFVLPAGGTLIVKATDDRGSPVPGVQTKVLDEKGHYWSAFFSAAEGTGREGVSVTPHISEGRYRVEVGALGYEDESLNVTIREGDTTDLTVRLRKSR